MNDNDTMKTFDSIEVRRPALAMSYLELLNAQPGRPIALFAPRRVGKTYFLDHDLTPTARKAGLVPVYADLWFHKSAPLEAVNHALEEALDDAIVPKGRVAKLAKTTVKKIGVGGASIEMGDALQRRKLPDAPGLRLDSLLARLAEVSKKKVLLMLDEIQTLGEVPRGDEIVAALRAALNRRKNEVAAVFTGSSQAGLAKLMSTAGSPMYQFAQLLDFPVLGDDFLTPLARHFESIHPRKTIALDDLRRLFARVGHKPALMKDIVKAMSAEGVVDVDEGLKRFISDPRQIAGWNALAQSLELFDRAVLVAIAQGRSLLSKETLKLLAPAPNQIATVAKVRASIEKLRKAGIVTKDPNTPPQIADELLAEYLASMGSSIAR